MKASSAFGRKQLQNTANYANDLNKPFDDEDESDRKMWTEKYKFGVRVLDISVPIFLSFPSSVIRVYLRLSLFIDK